MNYVILALSAAFLLGIFQVMMKITVTRISPAIASFVSLTVNAVFIWGFFAATTPFSYLYDSAVILYIIAGFLAPGIGRPLMFSSIKRLGATVASPLVNIYPVFVIFPSIVLLGEIPSLSSLLGVASIVLGVLVFQLEVSRRSSPGVSLLMRLKDRAILMPIAVAVLTGVSFVVRKAGLLMLNSVLLGAAVTTTTGSLVSALPVIAGSGKGELSLRSRVMILLLAGSLINSVTWILDFAATSAGDVVKVAPIEATAPLFTFFFSWIFLKEVEKITLPVGLGVLLSVAGVVLITTS